jgi:hypothetical protein
MDFVRGFPSVNDIVSNKALFICVSVDTS